MNRTYTILFVLAALICFACAEEVKVEQNQDLLVFKYLFSRHSVLPRLAGDIALPGDGESPEFGGGIKTIKAYKYPQDLNKMLVLDETSEYNVDGGATYASSVAFGITWFPTIALIFFVLWIATFFCCCCCCKCACCLCCCAKPKQFKLPELKGDQKKRASKDDLEKAKKKTDKKVKKLTKKRRNTTVCMNLVTCCLCAGSSMFFLAVLALIGFGSRTVIGRVGEIDGLIGRYMTEDNNLPKKIDTFVSTATTGESYSEVIARYAELTEENKLTLAGLMGIRSPIYEQCKGIGFDNMCCIDEGEFKLFFALDAIYTSVKSSDTENPLPADKEVEATDLVNFMLATTSDITTAVDNLLTRISSNACATNHATVPANVLSEPLISNFDSTIVTRLDSALQAIGIGDLISDLVSAFNIVFTEVDTQLSPVTSTISSSLQSILDITEDARTLNTAVNSITGLADSKSNLKLMDFVGSDPSMATLDTVLSQTTALTDLISEVDTLEADLGSSLSDLISFIPDPLSFEEILESTSDKISRLLLNTLFAEYGPLSDMISENLSEAETSILDINIDDLVNDVSTEIFDSLEVVMDFEPIEEAVAGGEEGYGEVEAHLINIMRTLQNIATAANEAITKGIAKKMWESGLDGMPEAVYSKVAPLSAKIGKMLKVTRARRGQVPANIIATLSEEADAWEVVDFEKTLTKGGMAFAFVLAMLFGCACVCTCCAGCKRSRCCSCCSAIHFTLTFMLALGFALLFAAINDTMVEGCNLMNGALDNPQETLELLVGDNMRPASTDDMYETYRKVRGELPLTSSTLNQQGATATIDINLDVLNDIQLNNLFNSFDDPKNLFVSLSIINTLNVVIDDVYSQLKTSNFVRDVITNAVGGQVASVKQSFLDATAEFYGPGSTVDTLVTQLDGYVGVGSPLETVKNSLSIDPADIAAMINISDTIISQIKSSVPPGSIPTADTTSDETTRCGFGSPAQSSFSGATDADVRTYFSSTFYTNVLSTIKDGATSVPSAVPGGDDCNAFLHLGAVGTAVEVPVKTIYEAVNHATTATAQYNALLFSSMIAFDDDSNIGAGTNNFRTWCAANAAVCSVANLNLVSDDTNGATLIAMDISTLHTRMQAIFTGVPADTEVVSLPHTMMSLASALDLIDGISGVGGDLDNLETATSGIVGNLDSTFTTITDLASNLGTVMAESTFTTIADTLNPAFDSVVDTIVGGMDDIVSGFTTTISDILGKDLNLMRTDITSYMKDLVISPVCNAGSEHPGFMAVFGYFSLGFSFILVGTCMGICVSCRGLRYFRVFPKEEEATKKVTRKGEDHDDHSETQSQYDSVYSSEVSYSSYSEYSDVSSPRGHHGHHGGNRPLHAGPDDMGGAYYINT